MGVSGQRQAGFSLPGSQLSKPTTPQGQVPAPLAEWPLCPRGGQDTDACIRLPPLRAAIPSLAAPPMGL